MKVKYYVFSLKNNEGIVMN